MIRRSWYFVALATLGIGCSHAGSGQGELESSSAGSGSAGAEASKGAIAFTWHSGADASKGEIEATTPGHGTFEGTYLQPTSTTETTAVDPYYGAWTDPGWGVGMPWFIGPMDNFTTQYSGKALAHLRAPDGTRMRCTFDLRDPPKGMAGGAEGDCQLSDNEQVFDAVLHNEPRHRHH